ncbi:MAG: hypothetical protein GX285_07770, partial [Clostridiales bacterium]|nr:hypothetical protein [Clostridiales bacterium]
EKCERIFISVQMHGYVIKDLNGKEITDYISWQDRRASLTPITLHLPSVSGTAVKENLPRAGVEAMVKTSEEFNNIKKEFFTLGSYIVYKITGINSTHITDAAASGYYNAFTCETLNSANILLPYATKDFVCLGKYKGMEIFSPVGDQQAAVLGSEAGERDYIINLGTAGQMCCISKDFVGDDFESRQYFGGITLGTVTELTAGKKMREGGD